MSDIDIFALASDVAQHMGKGWYAARVEDYPQSAVLRNDLYDYRLGITLWLDSRIKRIIISGQWPKDEEGKEYPIHSTHHRTRPDAITVKAERKPKSIADEINRRYWADYITSFDVGLRQLSEHTKYIIARDKAVNEIATIVKGQVSSDGERITTKTHPRGCGYIRDLYVSPNSVRIFFDSLPHDFAQAVLRMWMEWEPKEET